LTAIALAMLVVGCEHTSPLGTHSESYPVVTFQPDCIKVFVYPPGMAAAEGEATPADIIPMGTPGSVPAGGADAGGDSTTTAQGDYSPHISIHIGQNHAGSQAAEPDISASAAANVSSPSGNANADADTKEGEE